jgi:hypothetical protein
VALFAHSMTSVAPQDTSCIAQLSLHATQCNIQLGYVRKRILTSLLLPFHHPTLLRIETYYNSILSFVLRIQVSMSKIRWE